MSYVGAGLSGAVGPQKWGPDFTTSIRLMKASGMGAFSLPVWLATDDTADVAEVEEVVSCAHANEMFVSLVPHFDGASAGLAHLIDTAPATYVDMVTAIVDGSGCGHGDRLEFWNEWIPAGGWPGASIGYTQVAGKLQNVAHAAGMAAVLPIPMSQTPKDAIDALSAQLWNTQWAPVPDFYSAHVYKDVLNNDVPRLRTVAGLFGALDAFSMVVGAPIVITEFGGTLPAQQLSSGGSAEPLPDPSFYGTVARLAQLRDWDCFAWEWNDSGGGYTVQQVLQQLGLTVPGS